MTGIKEAVAEVESIPQGEKILWSKIADKHGVVRSTLTRNAMGETRPFKEAVITRYALTPQQEEELVKYIEALTDRHLPPTRQMIQNFASEIARTQLSESWVSRFLNRHPDRLTVKWSDPMTAERHNAESHEKYKEYFDILQLKINQYEVLPENTYNMDEKGFMIGVIGKSKRVFSKSSYGRQHNRQSLHDGNREWITLLAGVCADGSALPPGLIYAADSVNIQSTWVSDLDKATHSVFTAVSPTGWSNDDLGLGWLEQVFNRYTKKKARRRYRLLIMDGHGSHITMKFIEYCDKHKIILIIYPPHSTQTLQPLDVVMFKPISSAYSDELTSHLHNAQGLLPVKKGDFFRLFWAAWVRTFTEKLILKSFEATGIVPLDPDRILNKFTETPANSDSGSSSTSTVSSNDWRLADRRLRRSVKDINSKDARALRATLHHLSVDNQLLKMEVEGLREAMEVKKKHSEKGKALPFKKSKKKRLSTTRWYSPSTVEEARVQLRINEQEATNEKLRKANAKKLREDSKLLKLKLDAQKAEAREKSKEERTRLKEMKAQHAAERKAEQQRQKEARDAQKASQTAQNGKRKASQKAVPRKKQNRSDAGVRSGAVATSLP